MIEFDFKRLFVITGVLPVVIATGGFPQNASNSGNTDKKTLPIEMIHTPQDDEEKTLVELRRILLLALQTTTVPIDITATIDLVPWANKNVVPASSVTYINGIPSDMKLNTAYVNDPRYADATITVTGELTNDNNTYTYTYVLYSQDDNPIFMNSEQAVEQRMRVNRVDIHPVVSQGDSDRMTYSFRWTFPQGEQGQHVTDQYTIDREIYLEPKAGSETTLIFQVESMGRSEIPSDLPIRSTLPTATREEMHVPSIAALWMEMVQNQGTELSHEQLLTFMRSVVALTP